MHAAILACYTEFNNAGGAMLKLQYNDRLLYFPRAVILAVYADFPAGAKSTTYILSLRIETSQWSLQIIIYNGHYKWSLLMVITNGH